MSKVIDSWENLQQQIKSILEQINANSNLTLAAAANPLYALEEIGYKINPTARPEIEARLRFEPRTAVQLRQLQAAIFEQVGHPFDLNDPAQLQRVLFDELKISVPGHNSYNQEQNDSRLDTSPLVPQLSWIPKVEDPLEVLCGAHPVIEPLLEYRRLESSVPRLAPLSLYQEVRQGKRRLFLESIRGRLKTQPVSEG
ncbi:MAG: hypothetical protein RLP02_05095 [Coleofasciculus sp. C2-GNP5-27]